MKLKCQPADFCVEEQISLPVGRGNFAVWRLTKHGLTTPQAVEAVCDKLRLPWQQVAFAGLKDKHASTVQYLTIAGPARRGFSQTNLELEYVGQAERPIHASDITGNRFAIVVRDLIADEVARTETVLAAVGRDGIPNYFDEQRFGSLGESGEFIAKPWCLGDYERTLWLAIAEPNEHDSPRERDDKRLLRERWGDWPALAAALSRSNAGEIVRHLARQPGDFRRAITLVRQDLRSLWLAAFQSHLWNQILAEVVRQVCQSSPCTLQTIARRQVPFFGELSAGEREELQSLLLPLPSARLHLDDSPLQPLYGRVLAAEGIELRQVRVKYPRDSFFSKGERAAVVRPAELTYAAADDELYPGRNKLTLRFVLPRGAYATILIKRVFGEAAGLAADDESA